MQKENKVKSLKQTAWFFGVSLLCVSLFSYLGVVNIALAAPIIPISTFTIPNQIGTTIIDQINHTIALTMPAGTDVSALVPTITYTGDSISPDTGVAQNFTHPVTYTVTAADATTKTYTVTVAVSPWAISYDTSDLSITSFTTDTANHVLYAGGIGGVGTLYRCALSTGCDLSEDWTVALEQNIQSLAFDSANNVLYAGSWAPGSATIYRCETLSGCDTDQDWTVSYTTPDNSINSFTIDTADHILYAGGLGGGPNTLFRCALSTGCTSAENWTVALNQQIQSLTFDSANNVLYAGSNVPGFATIYRCETSTGCDTDQDWTVSYGPTQDGSITSFAIDSANHVLYAGAIGGGPLTLYRCALSTGCTSAENWTVALERQIDSLVFDSTNNIIYAGDPPLVGPGIIYSCNTSTGCDANGDWTVDFNSGGTNNYPALGIANGALYAGSNPDGIIYRKTFSSAKAITAFTIPNQVGDTTINGTNISLTMPVGTNVSALVPTITITGVSVNPNTGAAQDFTTPVTYTVTAADGTHQAYIVTVTLANPVVERRGSGRGGSVPIPLLTSSTSSAVIAGCTGRTTGFSTVTGQSCVGNTGSITIPIPSPYNFGTVTLRNGSRGDAVMELQRFLNDKLHLNLKLDGLLGPKTIAVIKQWQKAHGLVADGMVGPKTKAEMNAGTQ